MRRVPKVEHNAATSPANSVPLSTRKERGTPNTLIRRSRMQRATVEAARSGRAARMTNLLNVSTMVRTWGVGEADEAAGRSTKRSRDHSRRGPGGGGMSLPDQEWAWVARSNWHVKQD